MPKQTYKIEGFHGGLNSNADPRDIDDIEASELQNMKISKLGRLKISGAFSTISLESPEGGDGCLTLKDKGLYAMDADRKVSNNAESNETLLFLYDTVSNAFDVQDSGGFTLDEISINTTNPVYYNADGILRIGDGSFANEGKWYGYIAGAKFDGLNADSGDINDWISTDQSITTPTKGICLISDPTVGSDGDTVNSSNSEYDGNVADGSGDREPVEHSAVNLRVGIQHTEIFQNTTTDWSRNTNSPLRCTASDTTEMYPILGNNVIKIVGTTGSSNELTLANSDSGTSLEFQVTEEESLVFGINIGTSEYQKLSHIRLRITSTNISDTGYVEWRFTKDDLIEWSTNLLVCSTTNINISLPSADLDEIYDSITIAVFQESQYSGDDSSDYYLHPPIKIKHGGIEGFQPSVYEFYHSYLYDNSRQESLPFKFKDLQGSFYEDNKVNIVGNSILFNFDIYTLPYDNAGTPAYAFDKRIVGSRLYYKVEENDNYFLIGELDFVDNGFKWLPESDTLDYDMVNSQHPSGILAKASLVREISPNIANTIDTYKSINGFSTSVKSINARYKTAVVHGRRCYIGNVKKDGEIFSDRMIKSRVNKFDTFPSGMGVVDVAIRDGESIVKLEAFADRILQFKQKSLYIVNVSENVDFLEDVYRNKGCEFNYHVVKTDYGVAWFNKFGVYFFDGKRVINLLEKKGLNVIGEEDWEAFITDGVDGSADDTDMSSAHIGYIPRAREIYIRNENADSYIYNFTLGAWVYGSQQFLDFGTPTNFVTNSDQDLIYADSNRKRILKWTNDATSGNTNLYVTKDIDFGQPSVRKKIYKVYISYTSDGSGVLTVNYSVNGSDTYSVAGAVSAMALSKPKWTQAEYKFNNDAKSCFSFKLKLGANTAGSGFEINDITIVYRLKNVK